MRTNGKLASIPNKIVHTYETGDINEGQSMRKRVKIIPKQSTKLMECSHMRHFGLKCLSKRYDSQSLVLTFSCLNRRKILISRNVRWQYVWCSNGLIFLMATLCPVALSNAELCIKKKKSKEHRSYLTENCKSEHCIRCKTDLNLFEWGNIEAWQHSTYQTIP